MAQGLELGLVRVLVQDQVPGQVRPLHPHPGPVQALMAGLTRALKRVPMLGLEQDQDQVVDKVVERVPGPVLDMGKDTVRVLVGEVGPATVKAMARVVDKDRAMAVEVVTK